ncbi:uncharacterized protein BDR25DRAFT_222763, partial [Lindgomyces ingoldianus]
MEDPLSAGAVVISLPGIFMSCVQCFELIQCGRNIERDLLILTTKFSNQQLRFTKWGEACGLGYPNGYDPQLDDAQFKPNIERTLWSIKLVLDSGITVIESYETDPTEKAANVLLRGTAARWSWTAVKERLRKSTKHSGFKEATKWALADKRKLDDLVKHPSDLVGDLEYLTKDLGVPARQRILVQYEIESISDTETLEII